MSPHRPGAMGEQARATGCHSTQIPQRVEQAHQFHLWSKLAQSDRTATHESPAVVRHALPDRLSAGRRACCTRSWQCEGYRGTGRTCRVRFRSDGWKLSTHYRSWHSIVIPRTSFARSSRRLRSGAFGCAKVSFIMFRGSSGIIHIILKPMIARCSRFRSETSSI